MIRVVLCEVNTSNVFWIYFSNQIDSYTLQRTPLNYFDWGKPQRIRTLVQNTNSYNALQINLKFCEAFKLQNYCEVY